MAYWTLQANPSRYRILQAGIDFDETPWTANQYADQIQVGDKILVWLSGPNSGGYALGEVTAAATTMPEDPRFVPYWVGAGSDDDAKSLPRIRVRLTRRMYLHPLLRTECKEDPLLSQMHIMRQAAGTIFKITEEEWQRIQESIGEQSVEAWVQEELILVLSLYFDAKAKRFHDPEATVVAKLARLLNRDTKRLAAALGSFAYLDPESKGKGLVSATAEMKAIWADYGTRSEEVRREAMRIQAALLEGGGLARLREGTARIAAGGKAAVLAEKAAAWAEKRRDSGGADVQGESKASQLTLVKSQEEVRASIARFNQDAPQAKDRVRTLCRATTYWIFDPTTGKFGPGKFVGFAGIDFERYEAAMQGEVGGARFDGNTTRRAIERVLGVEFRSDPQMAVVLRTWGEGLLGAGAFDGGRGEDRWKFVVLPASTPKYWKIAPGEKAVFWQENRDSGLIAIGWGQAGDPRPFKSRDDLEAHYVKRFKYTKDQAQANVRSVWWFIRDIKPGDIIVANQGQSRVAGRGVVIGPAEFRVERGEWGNCLPVHWFDPTGRDVPKQKQWFTTISPMNADVYEALFGSDAPSDGEPEGDHGREPEQTEPKRCPASMTSFATVACISPPNWSPPTCCRSRPSPSSSSRGSAAPGRPNWLRRSRSGRGQKFAKWRKAPRRSLRAAPGFMS